MKLKRSGGERHATRRINEVEARFAGLLAEGAPPDGRRSMALAEEARLHIDGAFYPCTLDTHVKVAEMHEADARFRNRFESRMPGLTKYIADAVRANRKRHVAEEERRRAMAEAERGARLEAIKPGGALSGPAARRPSD